MFEDAWVGSKSFRAAGLYYESVWSNTTLSFQQAEELYHTMLRRFRQEKSVWLKYASFLLKQGQTEATHRLLERALKALPTRERKHSSISIILTMRWWISSISAILLSNISNTALQYLCDSVISENCSQWVLNMVLFTVRGGEMSTWISRLYIIYKATKAKRTFESCRHQD